MQQTFILVLLSALIGCASKARKEHQAITDAFYSKNFAEGLELLEKSKLKEKKSYLLYLMEKGSYLLEQKKYKEADLRFREGLELSEELYTKSIKDITASSVSNENASKFVGRVFERVMLLKLSNRALLNLDTKGETKNKIRANLKALDSLMQTELRQEKSKSLKSLVFASKVYGALMHDYLGTRRDKETALILLQNALKLTSDKAQQKFIQLKIIKLSKVVRKRNVKKLIKQYGIKADEILDSNIKFVIDSGAIAALEVKKVSLNLRSQIDKIKDPATKALVRGIGVPILTYFMLGPLGLGSTTVYNDNVVVHTRHNVGEKIVEEVGVEYEIPFVKVNSDKRDSFIELVDAKEKKVRLNLTPMINYDQVSMDNTELLNNQIKSKKQTRIALKYLTAVIAAYKTYESLTKSGNGDLFAKPAAYSQFLISQKAILASEAADTRHWGTLPKETLIADGNVPVGDYRVFLVTKKNDQETRQLLETIKFDESRSFFAYRAF